MKFSVNMKIVGLPREARWKKWSARIHAGCINIVVRISFPVFAIFKSERNFRWTYLLIIRRWCSFDVGEGTWCQKANVERYKNNQRTLCNTLLIEQTVAYLGCDLIYDCRFHFGHVLYNRLQRIMPCFRSVWQNCGEIWFITSVTKCWRKSNIRWKVERNIR